MALVLTLVRKTVVGSLECVNCGEEQLAYDEEHNKYHCFACGENYAGDALTFCSGCGSIMISNEVDLCDNCVAHKLED